jgi:hypothetical protein
MFTKKGTTSLPHGEDSQQEELKQPFVLFGRRNDDDDVN